jgi:hypothetical protein
MVIGNQNLDSTHGLLNPFDPAPSRAKNPRFESGEKRSRLPLIIHQHLRGPTYGVYCMGILKAAHKMVLQRADIGRSK